MFAKLSLLILHDGPFSNCLVVWSSRVFRPDNAGALFQDKYVVTYQQDAGHCLGQRVSLWLFSAGSRSLSSLYLIVPHEKALRSLIFVTWSA